MSLAERLETYVIQHRADGILVDTNVLLLFIFATFMPDKIEGSKRLAKYDRASGDLLLEFVKQFDKIVVTSHVLAETSSLARQNVKGLLWSQLATEIYPLFCMQDFPGRELRGTDAAKVDQVLFSKLGLTDAAIVANLDTTLLLTDDLDLYLAAVGIRCDAINFTHMREAAGLV